MPWAPDILVPWTKLEHGPKRFSLADIGVRQLADGDVIQTATGDASLRALYTPGHTVDHSCFVLEQEGALFSGDHVLGGSSGVFEDLHSYMKSLDKALNELPKGEGGRIYPGHGPVIEDGHAGVVAYLENRRTREKQVIDALQDCRWGLTPIMLVRRIYPSLSLTLTMAAASNVEKALRKLERDGRARVRFESPCPIRFRGFSLDGAFATVWTLRD